MAAKNKLRGRYHYETKWVKFKTAKKGNPSICLAGKRGLFRKKLLFFAEDTEDDKLLHFKNLKKYLDETNATINANYFSITIKKICRWNRWEVRATQNKQKYSRVHSKSFQHKS